MRKGLIKLIAILAMFGAITSVDAASISKGDTAVKTYADTFGTSLTASKGGSSNPVKNHKYAFDIKDKNGKSKYTNVIGYCLDPISASPKGSMTINDVLGESTSADIQKRDAAYTAILKNGYRSDQTSGFGVSGNDFYMATSIALRTYALIIRYSEVKDVGTSLASYASPYVHMGADIVSQTPSAVSYLSSSIFELQGKTNQAEILKIIKDWYAVSRGNWYQPEYTVSGGDAIMNAARQLFALGMEATNSSNAGNGNGGNNNGGNNNGGTPTVTFEEFAKFPGVSNDPNKEVQEVYINVRAENLTDDHYIKNVTLECENCDGFELGDLYYATDGANYSPVTTDMDLKEKLDPQKGVLTLKFEVVKDLTVCQNAATYKIKYQTSGDVEVPSDSNAFLVSDSGGSTQRYIFYVPDENNGNNNNPGGNGNPDSGEPVDNTFEGQIDCNGKTPDPDGDPDDPDKADPDPEEYEEPDPKNPCNSLMSSPVCDDENSTTTSEKDGKILAIDPNGSEKSVKYCILDNKDAAGNTYRLSETNGGIENPYCRVFCKEDYDPIKMSDKIEDARCGGYFQLNASITGRKDCYTSGGNSEKSKNDSAINRPKLDRVVAKYQTKAIGAYDAYQKNVTLTKNMTTSDSCPANGGNYIIQSGTLNTYKAGVHNNGVVPVEKGTASIKASHPVPSKEDQEFFAKQGLSGKLLSISGKTITVLGDGSSNTIDVTEVDQFGVPKRDRFGNIITTRYTVTYMSQDAYDQKYAPMCVTKDEMETYINKESIGSLIVNSIQVFEQEDKDNGLTQDELKERMEKYNGQKNSSIDMFNSCTVDTGEYKTWTMNFNSFNTNSPVVKWSYTDPYNDLLDESKRVMLPVAGNEGTEEVEVCFGELNDDGTCSGSSVNSIEDSSIMENVTYTACDENGCATNSTKEVSRAKFIRKSVVDKTVEYQTPSVFYQADPLGKISVTEGTSSNVTTNLLEHLLPISLNATGLETFTLSIDKLGEYYDSGEVGRLIGGTNSVASVIGTSGNNNFDGNYKCYVDTHCDPKQPDNCPECDYDCEWDGDPKCEWVECPECVDDCINCIFTLEQLQLNFTTVSNTNISSTPGKTMGYNWDINTSLEDIDLSIIRDKAEATLDEIKDKNDTIYEEVDFDNKSKYENNDDTSLAFSIKMTSDIIKDLQKYNEENEQYGGYGNPSLKCEDSGQFKGLLCYSEVLDDLKSKYDDNIIAPHRGDSSKYWQLWQGVDPGNIGNGSVIGGPAWR